MCCLAQVMTSMVETVSSFVISSGVATAIAIASGSAGLGRGRRQRLSVEKIDRALDELRQRHPEVLPGTLKLVSGAPADEALKANPVGVAAAMTADAFRYG
jgi:hypothetical protein